MSTLVASLEANADTYVRADADVRINDNYGKDPNMNIGTGRGSRYRKRGEADAMRCLVHFNTHDLPTTVDRAVLELVVHGYGGTPRGPFDVTVHRVTSAWNEGNGSEVGPGFVPHAVGTDPASGVAWEAIDEENESQPDFDDKPVASAGIDPMSDVAGTVVTWDVTSLVRDWVSRKHPNYGLMLRDATGDGRFRELRLATRECENHPFPTRMRGPRLQVFADASFKSEISRTKAATVDRVGDPTVTRSGDFVCRVRQRDLVESHSEHLLLDPTPDIIYPGSVLDAGSVSTGEYRPLIGERTPLTISISTEFIADGDVFEVVGQPSLSGIRSAKNRLVQRAVTGSNPANVSADIHQAHSTEQLRVELGGQYKKGAMEISAGLDLRSESTKARMLVRYQQVYYTIDVDRPDGEGGFFKDREVQPGDAYVSSVTYGRLLIFSFESDEGLDQLESSLNAVVGETFDVDARLSHRQTIERSTCKVLIRGGGRAGLETITDEKKIAAINRYIESGAEFSKESPAYPLAYRLRFLSDHALAQSNLSTTFTERQCAKVTSRHKCVVKKIEYTNGVEARQELFGRINVDFLESREDPEPVATKTVWNKDIKHSIDVRKEHAIALGGSLTHTYTKWHNPFDEGANQVRDTAFLRVHGRISDVAVGVKIVWTPFPVPRPTRRAQVIGDFSHEVMVATDVGEHVVDIKRGRTHVKVYYEVEPQYD